MDKLVSVKKPHRRICPRCHSHNTKLCYIVNSSQRYTCKHCRRCWTHGWALRNIPIGGRGLKTKYPKLDQPSVSQVSSLENHFGSLPVVLALPARSAPPMDRMEISDRSYNYQGFHDVGSSGANQEDPNKKFNDTMDKNHNASTSGSSEYPGTGHVIKNNNNNNNNNNV